MPQIDLIMNARQFNSEAKKAGQSVDDISTSLDDVAKEGDGAADKLERSFRDIASDAKKASNAIDDVGTTGRGSLDKVKGGATELQQELGSNLGEAVSSVRGDLSDLGQVGQDTLGGLAATIAGSGPAGLVGAAALAAGAVGLGMVTAELQQQQEEADKLRERLGSAFEAAVEDGRNYIDTAQLISEANDVMFNPDRAKEWKQLQAEAKGLSLDNSVLIAANGGNLDAQQEVLGRINALRDDALKKETDILTPQSAQVDTLDDMRQRWEAISGATAEFSEKARTAQAVTDTFLRAAISGASEATKEVDEFGNELYTLPDGKQVVIDAQTGQASQDLDKFKGDLDGVAEKVIQPVIKPRLDTSAWDNWRPSAKTGTVNVGNIGTTGRSMSWE